MTQVSEGKDLSYSPDAIHEGPVPVDGLSENPGVSISPLLREFSYEKGLASSLEDSRRISLAGKC